MIPTIIYFCALHSKVFYCSLVICAKYQHTHTSKTYSQTHAHTTSSWVTVHHPPPLTTTSSGRPARTWPTMRPPTSQPTRSLSQHHRQRPRAPIPNCRAWSRRRRALAVRAPGTERPKPVRHRPSNQRKVSTNYTIYHDHTAASAGCPDGIIRLFAADAITRIAVALACSSLRKWSGLIKSLVIPNQFGEALHPQA